MGEVLQCAEGVGKAGFLFYDVSSFLLEREAFSAEIAEVPRILVAAETGVWGNHQGGQTGCTQPSGDGEFNAGL